MTAEASNILSLINPAISASAPIDTAATAESPVGLDFAAALFQQLGVLQAQLSGAETGAAMPINTANGFENLQHEAFSEQNLQNFAAFFGNRLPTGASSDETSINLDDTLATLSGVLQSLQQLQTQPTAQPTVESPLLDEPKDSTTDTAQTEIVPMAPDAAMFVAPVVTTPIQPPVLPTTPASDEAAAALLNTQPAVSESPATDIGKLKQSMPEFRSHRDSQNASSLDSPNQLPLKESSAGDTHSDSSFGASDQPAYKSWGNELAPQQEPSNTANHSGDKNSGALGATLQQLNQAISQPNTAPSTPPAMPAMQRYFGDSQWNEELGNQLIWMHKQEVSSAELRLNPEHLGPVLVKINVQNDQANVTFTTQHLAVKEAIEAALPKLREMMQGQQLNLSDVNVSQQHSEQQNPKAFFQMNSDQQRQRGARDPDMPAQTDASEPQHPMLEEIETGRALSSNGLLSLFA